MRITEHEKNVIAEAVKNINSDTKIWLFGFKTNDKADYRRQQKRAALHICMKAVRYA
jgi:hypothetical protein